MEFDEHRLTTPPFTISPPASAMTIPANTSRPRDSQRSEHTSKGYKRVSSHSIPNHFRPKESSSLAEDVDAYELQTYTPAREAKRHDRRDRYEENTTAQDGRQSRSRSRSSSTGSLKHYELYTPAEDRAVRRKLDRNLVGFMALLYLLSFLDRSSEAPSLSPLMDDGTPSFN